MQHKHLQWLGKVVEQPDTYCILSGSGRTIILAHALGLVGRAGGRVPLRRGARTKENTRCSRSWWLRPTGSAALGPAEFSGKHMGLIWSNTLTWTFGYPMISHVLSVLSGGPRQRLSGVPPGVPRCAQLRGFAQRAAWCIRVSLAAARIARVRSLLQHASCHFTYRCLLQIIIYIELHWYTYRYTYRSLTSSVYGCLWSIVSCLTNRLQVYSILHVLGVLRGFWSSLSESLEVTLGHRPCHISPLTCSIMCTCITVTPSCTGPLPESF